MSSIIIKSLSSIICLHICTLHIHAHTCLYRYKQLADSCRCADSRDGTIGNIAMSNSEHCKDLASSVQPAGEVYSHSGLLTMYLSTVCLANAQIAFAVQLAILYQDELAVASFRIKMSAVFFAVCGLLFAAVFVFIG